MGQMALIFSLIFFITFSIELLFGAYVLYMNPKGKLNRQFFAISIALCFWSFGFAMGNIAKNQELCLLWRRFSAIGWTVVYAMLFHLILIIVNKDEALKRWHYFLLYLPAAISLYVFSISKSISIAQYNFARVDYGWINIAANNAWDIFFYIYYISYILVGIGLLLYWKSNSDDQMIKKQANLILFSIISIVILGTFTDIILSSVTKISLPQIAPIFNIIPIIGMFYLVRSNSHMKRVMEKGDSLILSSEHKVRLYSYLITFFLFGGTISSLPYFFPKLLQNDRELKAIIYGSISLYSVGVMILIFQFIKNQKLKDLLVLSAVLLSIPITTFRFIEYAAITIWVFPIVLMIISLAFDSKLPLISVLIVSVITQILVWINTTKGLVRIDGSDFVIRIGILIVAFGIGMIINRIYVKKLKENIYQTNFQKIISEASSEFLNVNMENVDGSINKLLGKIGCFFEIDRSYIFMIDDRENVIVYSYEWCNEGIEAEIGVKNVALDTCSWWMKQLEDNGQIYIKDVDDLPSDAYKEKRQLKEQGVKSVIVVPIEDNNEIIGFIGCNSIRNYKKWTEYHIDLLKTLSNMLSNGLIKIKSEKKIEHMAFYDHLTGLPNRILFEDRVNQAIETAKRNGKFIAVMFMDLDSFKMINDTMGHSGGDKVLKDISNILTSTLRRTDTIARFGGDEFLILLNNIENIGDVNIVADKIMDILKRPLTVDEHEFFITGSGGISIYPIDGEDVESLIKNADIAMYKAKANGKNQYKLCTSDMKEEVKQNMILSNHLFRARERNELMVYYQPQVNLRTGEIIGLEALLRWNHPKFGMIPPSEFIPLAEKSGVINSIGEWVFREACMQNKKWHDEGLLSVRVAVNMSVIQFGDPLIVEKVEKIIKETAIDPAYVELEITESVAVKEGAQIVNILNRLKDLGVSISIDDFGTEYSSLSRLKMLPIDRIKIDMQFIHGIEGDKKDQAITKIIIGLAKSLDLEVIAEGVETPKQLEFLNRRMCDDAQGYYYYKPMPAEELEKLLVEKRIYKISETSSF